MLTGSELVGKVFLRAVRAERVPEAEAAGLDYTDW